MFEVRQTKSNRGDDPVLSNSFRIQNYYVFCKKQTDIALPGPGYEFGPLFQEVTSGQSDRSLSQRPPYPVEVLMVSGDFGSGPPSYLY